MSWELTDAGRLYEALCSGPGWALVDGTWVRATGTGRLFSDGVGCVLLGGLTGYVKMPEFSSLPTTVSMLTPVPDITDPVLIASRNAVVDSQRDTLGNPAFGVPLRSGPHAMRLVSVTDDLGRMLHFSYGSSGVEKGMLQSVTGPAGASVTFTYQNPVGQSALPVPEGLNELFLRRAMRTDVATSDPEVLAAGGRGFEFQYAFERTDQMPNDITTALTAYRDFFRSVYNCGFQTRDQCGKLYAAGAMFVNLDALLDAQRRRLFSEAADNITTVTVKDEAGGVGYIESETRYASNVYDEHFDKVRAQRWGSVADPSLQAVQNHPQLPFTWQTALPLATFDYQEAVPRSTSSGVLTGDETDDFLPQHLRTRYPLEVAAGPAIQMSWNKGLLLPAHSPAGLPPANRLPMLAVDSPQVSVDGQLMPGCGLSRLPELRTRLPGYQPSLDYYDRTLPTANLPTPGVSWTQGLERSRVSCNTLALALTYDVTHNDLASTWQKAMNGDYVFETMTGRRAHIAANANRICAWSRYIDRDGDVHYSGVNFQGRALVDAVRVMNGTQEIWKVAESLYNADGNVLSQRRTTSGGTAWTEAAGDTRYSYLEEVIPAHSIHTVRPYYWARRGNVVYVLDRPRGGTVWDEVEGQPGTKVQSAGRYSSYGYDPFFNQVTFVESGNRTTSGTDEPTSRTHVVMDYQEYANASVPEFGAMLDELQSWGAQLRRTTNGYDWTFIRANQLFVDFHGVDVNGDGVVGGQSAVPVLIERQGGNFAQNPASEFTFLSWSAGGAPASVLSPDKTLTTFSYYHVEQPPRGQTDLPATGDIAGSYSGFLAAITTTRKSWPSSAGPARPSCAALPPQYRFLLRSCGADLPTSLAQLGLSPEAVEGVLSASAGKTTRFAYNAAGHVSAVRGPAGALTKSIADTDGRVRRTDLFAHAAPTAHSRVETEYDRFMRPYRTRRYTGTGESLGATLRSFDNDNRVLTECRETATGGCDSGGSPTHRTTQRWIYTREGDLFRHVDPEGLVTEYRRDGRKWVTLEKLISPVPGEGERLAAWTWDDDGNVQTRLYGTGSAVLSESMTWDGFGRRIGHVDTQGRRWFYGHSKRDLTVTSTHDSTSAPWSELFTWDSFGRLYSVEQNGLVTAEYWRLPGGLPFATSAAGRAPSFVTYDEVGRVVFAEDAAGNQSVSTETGASATSAHRITQSTIRKRPSPSLPLTTGTIATLDVLGLPSELREVGATLSRTTAVLARTGSGFVKRVRAPDGSLTEADYDFLGRILELRQQRAFGGVDYDRSTYSYNARGQLDTQVDPAGNTTVQRYTGFGDPLFKSAPASKPVESHWQYDALGRKVQHLVGNTVDLGYRYESATGRLEAIVRGDPSNTQAPVLQEFSYDELGRWTRSKHNNLGVGTAFGLVPESREVETSRTYDDAAQRYTETTRVGVQSSRTVTADWDVTVNNTWLRTLTLPDARTLTESFDFDGRQVGLGRANGGVTDFTWVDELLAETASTKTGTPLKRTVGFDGLAQPVSWNFTHQATGPSALTVDVRRDVMGRIGSSSVRFTTPSGSAPSWRGYAYDAMGRLSLVREAGAIPSSLPAPHQLPAAMESAVEGAGDAVSAERWAYAREVAVGSVLSISRTDVTATPPRFFAPANYQTPFGTPTARLEGHQLDSYEVGASGTRTVAHDEAGRVTSDGTQDFVYDDFGALVVVRE
ncbi:MAG: RHS repeat protein, partial [Myxococcales bacterium]|nr:RHS repeat protein [Myxococcales bacterium]